MINVSGIENGIEIDHIPAGKGWKIFQKLNLNTIETPVVLLMGVRSTRMGQKDIIKIEGRWDVDLDLLALIDPDITTSRIVDGKVAEKKAMDVPVKVKGLFACANPRCVSRIDQQAVAEFTLVRQNGSLHYQCNYCAEVPRYSL